MSDRDQRTEQPTARRLEKARTEGQFPVSRDFLAGWQFLLVTALAASLGGALLDRAAALTRDLWLAAFRFQVTPLEVVRLFVFAGWRIFAPLAAAGLAVAAATLAVHLAITRFGFAWKKLRPQGSRLNPARRLRELPAQNLPQLLQAAVLMPLICAAVWLLVQDRWGAFVRLPLESAGSALRVVGDSVRTLLRDAAWLLLLFGAFDLYRQKRRHARGLRMTRQEVRDEAKESEGNPLVKSRLRRLRSELLRRRMMAEVPAATAVVVNPTHYAVALRYDLDQMAAPKVVAKGKNYLAQRIRALAREHGVPIIENPPLAQTLYRAVEVGQEIPPALYRVVAEVLAYLFSLRGWRR